MSGFFLGKIWEVLGVLGIFGRRIILLSVASFFTAAINELAEIL